MNATKTHASLKSVFLLFSTSMLISLLSVADVWGGSSHASERYSSIQYSPDAGDVVGLEVILVPYTGGTRVLWRMASGRIEEPVLLSPRFEGKKILVDVPSENGPTVTWVLLLKGAVLTASSPNGDTYRLQKR